MAAAPEQEQERLRTLREETRSLAPDQVGKRAGAEMN
jgi:hypothetical protein